MASALAKLKALDRQRRKLDANTQKIRAAALSELGRLRKARLKELADLDAQINELGGKAEATATVIRLRSSSEDVKALGAKLVAFVNSSKGVTADEIRSKFAKEKVPQYIRQALKNAGWRGKTTGARKNMKYWPS